ncbi:hypothetical protein DYBT9275_05694 [Dyadobacter sp. CECT 9275]|uniref:FecR family protein n=1 Tax=Dyadobacter helix TaxID=2822344 RepID=A0A916JHK4_9BACT|nr:FecR domain-containing protein [Dyadobacter sp. CECT 9275]CAG5017069.1 hypothetical protein DYBT9275_05694 [Dyadobacter sp. CECT 9275]
MKESLIKILLFDFFDGKTTSIQRKLIEEWMEDTRNQDTYYRYLDEWESTHPQFQPELDQALLNYHHIRKGKSVPATSLSISEKPAFASPINKWLWVAAVACTAIFGGYVFRKQIWYETLESLPGKTVAYTLPEGTEVLLNGNSQLLVPRFGFGDDSREVFLSGEAEFNVTHTSRNDRFIVSMSENYQIEVLGTEFIAFSRDRGKRVYLKNGKVKLQLPEGKQLYMKPGNLFVANNKGDFKMTEAADPRPYAAWKQRTFYFNNTLLSEVAVQIREQFDVDVRIADTLLAKRRIAGIFKAEQADDLLQILSELLEIEITQKDHFIELSTSKIP